jgi:hypothetical protein
MSRLINAGSVAYEQFDFYYPLGSVTRPSGILSTDLTCTAFVNNGVLSWPMISGVSIPDSSISSGSFYFSQIQSGFYSLRFFPHMTGFWHVVVKHTGYGIEITKDYDIVPSGSFRPNGSSGLNASFVR